MSIALGLVLLGALLVYGGVTGKSITSLLTGDNQTPRTPPKGGDGSTGTAPVPTGVNQPGRGDTIGTGILPTIGKIIGKPYEGTHAKAFNQAGGSDNWQSENAVDVSTPVGTPIYAPVSGIIGRTGSLGKGGRFEGLRINLGSSADNFYFAHLSFVNVREGDRVNAGQLLGYSGSANGVPHLHFAVENGSPFDWLVRHIVTGH